MLVPLNHDSSKEVPRLPIPEGGTFHQLFHKNGAIGG